MGAYTRAAFAALVVTTVMCTVMGTIFATWYIPSGASTTSMAEGRTIMITQVTQAPPEPTPVVTVTVTVTPTPPAEPTPTPSAPALRVGFVAQRGAFGATTTIRNVYPDAGGLTDLVYTSENL